MPTVTITALERSDAGESGSAGSAELGFIAAGSDDYADVVAALPGPIPAILDGLPRQSIGREGLGGGFWRLTARYAYSAPQEQQSTPPLDLGDERITWDTTGGTTVRRTHATRISVYAPPSGTVPDNGDAINVTPDGVEGVDVEAGGGILTIESVITPAQATTTYGRRLLIYSKRVVNNASWRGFAAGEVRFMGGRMSLRADGNWDLVRIYEVSENVTGGTFAGVTGIAKKGHEYMWALTEQVEDTTAERLVQRTVGVTVHEVYPQINFALLDP